MKINVSVIVPVYNVEKYLKSCIESIVNQTLKDIEIILVNDGSTDKSGEICDDFAKKDNRIFVIHKENGGLSDARNAGLKQSNGQYISFLDSDDWFEPLMLQHYYSLATKNSADIVIGGMKIEYEKDGYIIDKKLKNKTYDFNNLFEGILECEQKGLFNPVCNKLYSASIIKNRNISFKLDGMPAEDLLFNCKVFQNANSLVLSDETYYHYIRRNEESLVTRYYENYYDKIRDFKQARKDLYDYFGVTNNIGKNQFNKSYLGYLYSSIINLYKKQCKLPVAIKLNTLRKIKEDILTIESPTNLYNDFFSKLLSKIVLNDNLYIAHIKYSILFNLRSNFKWIYVKFRKIVFTKEKINETPL